MRRLLRLSPAEYLALGSSLVLVIAFLYLPWITAGETSLTGLTYWALTQDAYSSADAISQFFGDLVVLAAALALGWQIFRYFLQPGYPSGGRYRLVIPAAVLIFAVLTLLDQSASGRANPADTLTFLALAAASALLLVFSRLIEANYAQWKRYIAYGGLAAAGVFAAGYALSAQEKTGAVLMTAALVIGVSLFVLRRAAWPELFRRLMLLLLIYTAFMIIGYYGFLLREPLVPGMLVIAIAAIAGLMLVLWRLSTDFYKQLAADLLLAIGLMVLTSYAIHFITLLQMENAGALQSLLDLGFWAILLAGLGYVGQSFLTRGTIAVARGVSSPLIPLIGIVVGSVIILRALENIGTGGYGLETFARQLTFGFAQGSVYALIALGYTLVYGILFMINFAHGEVFMSGAYIGFFAAAAMADTGFLEANPLVSLVIVFAIAVMTSVTVAIGLERIAYRPLRSAPRLVPLITAIGASIFLQEAFKSLFGPSTRRFPTFNLYLLPQVFNDLECDVVEGVEVCLGMDLINGRYPVEFFGIEIIFRPLYLVVFILAMVMMFALWFFVRRTRTGKAMRAVAEDKPTASLMGINVDGVIVTTFVLGGALAGVAAILFALYNSQVGPRMGFLPGLKAFTAAVLGGIGNIPGAAIGGYFLGIIESVAPSLLDIPSQLKDVIAFSILVLVLIFRPSGILGEVLTEKKA